MKNHLEINLNIESYEETSLANGENAYIFYLIIDNKTTDCRKINLLKSTYRTAEREQLEQDNWLTGYITGEAELKPNSFIKAGLVFYKTKLKFISENDTIYVTLQLPEEGAEITVSFKNEGTKWIIAQTEITEIELKLTPKQQEKILQQKIESVTSFEELLKIRLEKLSIQLDNGGNGWFKLLGELHLQTETELKETIELVCVLYDKNGGILDKKIKIYHPEYFMNFDVFEFTFVKDNIATEVALIKVFPKK